MALVHRLGRWGEEVAARYLMERGWRIRGRNLRFGARELDLVAQRRDLIAFVEVKTRSQGGDDPIETVGARKRREIRAAAAQWIRAHGRGRTWYRFDVIGVVPRPHGPPVVEHVEDAWRAD